VPQRPVAESFCFPFDLLGEQILVLAGLELSENASLSVRTLRDAAWPLGQQSGELRDCPCSNDRRARPTASRAQSNPGSAVVDASRKEIRVEILFLSVGHCEA
jgi:hypothetical protein